MKTLTMINENLARLTLPYQDIYTTVYIVKTDNGTLLFDAASFDEDVPHYIAPALEKLGVTDLKYIFISHNHRDHAGALAPLLKRYPSATVVSRCPRLKDKFSAYSFVAPEDGDRLLNVLQVVTVPGHTQDAAAILDTRTNTLISGDCLQLYGIFGSGKWAANITLIPEHLEAINKLRSMKIAHILTAHDYHPFGYSYEDSSTITGALDACIAPLKKVKELITQNPAASDEEIADLYNCPALPTLGAHVVTAVRAADL